MPQRTPYTSARLLVAAAALFGAHPLWAQNLPQAPDSGEYWDSMAQGNAQLPQPRSTSEDFNAFAPTAVDAPTIASLDPQSVSISSLSADAAWTAANISRGHTFPGGVAAFDALGTALIAFSQTPEARGAALLRIAEIHLRLLGDANNAAIIATGARILTQNETQPAVSYMRGIAQDLRKVGAIAGAQYLENAATLVADGLGDSSAGILDAATLALQFGAAPQPDLARILSYDPAQITDVQTRDLIVALLARTGTSIGDSAYTDLSQSLDRNATPSGITYIQERIAAAKTQAQRDAEQRRSTSSRGPTNNSFSTIIDRN